MPEGSYWFRRFKKKCHEMSPHLRFKKIRMGFYRIYWQEAYLHEVYKDMPEKGYNLEDLDPRLEDKDYYEEYEDQIKMTREVKNYVEGYWDSLDKIRTRLFMIRHDKEFNEKAKGAYEQMIVK